MPSDFVLLLSLRRHWPMENEINLSQSLCITWQLCAAAYWRDQRILLQRQQKGLDGGKEEESEWIKLISLRNPTSSQKGEERANKRGSLLKERGDMTSKSCAIFFSPLHVTAMIVHGAQ